jgi:DNA processing protein
MQLESAIHQHRLALAARAPDLSAAQLLSLAAASPDLAILARPSPAELAQHGLTTRTIGWFTAPDQSRIDADLRWLERAGATLVPATDPNYPALLLVTADAPAVLYVRGQVRCLAEPQLAMVGSRNPTAGGRATAREFAAFFAGAGLTITSGLAIGIDAACHEGALAGEGFTIGVLGSALDMVYPPENEKLAERVVEGGALISEFPPGLGARPHHFPQRNRIIAGMSHGTLVVEAARESGSLITARLAGEVGRDVFAIPGSIHNPCARGCHQLIRSGAKLVETAEDVLCELKISLASQLVATTSTAANISPTLDKEYKILLDALAFEPVSVDSLIERTGMNSASIASMLLILELDGYVQPHPGGRFSRMAGQ